MEEKMVNDLHKVHEVEIEIMDLIHDICVKNDIKYSLAYGTLIGAVRHQGFIPWDDDIDIFMTRDDYERFKKVWYEGNHDGYFLQDIYIEEEFTQNFMKVRKDNTLFLQKEDIELNYHKGIFVDIFPLDRVPNGKISRIIQYCWCAVNLLLCQKFNSGTTNKIQLLVENTILYLPKSVQRKLLDLSFWHLKKYNYDNSLCFAGNSTLPTIKKVFNNDIFDSLIETEYEGRKYFIFRQCDHVLRTEYGDYMQLPPEKERTWKHAPLEIEC